MAKSREAFRTISEVSEWLETPAHVLRFWESRFNQIKPVKRAGGRRYYRPSDMMLLGGIKRLLHDDGITIKGVQKILREKGVKYVSSLSLWNPEGSAEAKREEVVAEAHETTPISEILNESTPAKEDKTVAKQVVTEDHGTQGVAASKPVPASDRPAPARPFEVVQSAPKAPAKGDRLDQIAALYLRLLALRNRVHASLPGN